MYDINIIIYSEGKVMYVFSTIFTNTCGAIHVLGSVAVHYCLEIM